MKYMRKMAVGLTIGKFFIFNRFDFKNKNFLALKDELLESDKKYFFLDERISSDDEYIKCAYVAGVKHLFNQTEADTKVALKRYKLIKIVDFILKVSMSCGLVYITINQFHKLKL